MPGQHCAHLRTMAAHQLENGSCEHLCRMTCLYHNTCKLTCFWVCLGEAFEWLQDSVSPVPVLRDLALRTCAIIARIAHRTDWLRAHTSNESHWRCTVSLRKDHLWAFTRGECRGCAVNEIHSAIEGLHIAERPLE